MKKKLLITVASITILGVTGGAYALTRPNKAPKTYDNKTYYIKEPQQSNEEIAEAKAAAENPTTVVVEPEPTSPPKPVVPDTKVYANPKPTKAFAEAQYKLPGQVSTNTENGRRLTNEFRESLGVMNHSTEWACSLYLASYQSIYFMNLELYKLTFKYVLEKYGDPCIARQTLIDTGDF